MANKIIIEFIDDIESANMALNAHSYYAALIEIKNYLRSVEKYEELSEEVYNKVSDIRDHVNEIIQSNYIDI